MPDHDHDHDHDHDRRTLTLTLPPAADATSRFLTIRRLNAPGLVVINARSGELIAGGGNPRSGSAVSLDDRADYVTLVSDGSSWYVFGNGR